MSDSDVVTRWEIPTLFRLIVARYNARMRHTDVQPPQEIMTAYYAIVVGNIVQEPVKLIGAFLGLDIVHGNVLSGREPWVPPPLALVEQYTLRQFSVLAHSHIDGFPKCLSDDMHWILYQTIYIWQRFLRLPGQRCDFLANGHDLWRYLHSNDETDRLR